MGSTKVGKQKRFLEHNISAQPFKVFKLTDSSSQKEAHGCWKIDLESDNEKLMQLGCRNSEKSFKETRGYIPESAPSECFQTRSIPCQYSESSQCKESFAFEGELNDLKASEKEKIAYNLLSIDSPELKRILFMFILQNAWKAQKVQRSMPLPVLIADKELDLFLLRQKVKEMEGDQNLSSEEWGQVAANLGFTSNYGPSLKSIYATYLKPMEDRHILEIYGGKVAATLLNTIEEIIAKCSSTKQDCEVASAATLVAESEPFSAFRPSECEKVEGIQSLKDDEVLCSFKNGLVHPISLVTNLDNEKRKLSVDCLDRMPQTSCLAEVKLFVNKGCEFDASAPQLDISGQLELNCRGQRPQEDSHGTNGVPVNEGTLSVEINYDDFKNAVQWMKRVALNPGDPKQGQGPRGSVQNKQWADECTTVAYKLRSCLWKRSGTFGASYLNKEEDTHFSKNYYDASDQGHNSSNSLMVSRDLKKDQVFPLARSIWREHSIADLHDKASSIGLHGKIKSLRLSAKVLDEIADFGNHGALRKRIPIGSDFQADIPQCSPETYPSPTIHRGRTPCSSSHEVDRWLGRQVWPLPGGKRVVSKERIGRGRPLSCSCPNPESSACHRSHIRFANAQLMLEIDDAFSIWGFDEMGEKALACWTKEEQETFQVTIKTNPASADKFFWNELPAAFPSRSMRDLVSHYFNIYVLRGREIQNRLHLEEVDSDDDEDTLSKAYIKNMDSTPVYLKQAKSV